MNTNPTDPNERNDAKMRMAYFETHGLPYILHHLQMRNTGLQVFTAVRGALLLAWVTHPHLAIGVLGLSAVLSFWLWDQRNRFIFKTLREFGERLVDREIFGVGEDGKAKDGINKLLEGTITDSGRFSFFSHTWAIRVLLITSTVIWVALLYKQVIKVICAFCCSCNDA